MDMDSLVLHTRKGVLSTKLIPVHLPQMYIFDEQDQQNGHLFFQFNKTVIRNDFLEKVAHVFAYLFLIKMLHTSVPRVMKKYHDEHNFRL